MTAVLLAGCGKNADDTFPVADAVASGPPPTLRAVDAFPNLAFTVPTFVAHAGDGSNRLFVVEKGGTVRVFDNRADVGSASLFLDWRAKVDASTDDSGMLGLAFDPDFRDNGVFYVSYVTRTPARRVRVSRLHVSVGDRNAADPASEQVVYEYDHGNDWHYGGWLGFGPDRMLYVSTGDNQRDPRLRDPASPYGKVLRLRVGTDGAASAPTDNPFGNFTWAMGLRNPWRCAFDRANGDLWCGDVGEDQREEVDLVRRGADYGWDHYEGELTYRMPVTQPYASFEPAVHVYGRGVGGSVIGGYVYRGTRHPSLVGRYVFGDLIAGTTWTLTRDSNGVVTSVATLATGVGPITTFGEDERGEIYAATATGRILRFDPP